MDLMVTKSFGRWADKNGITDADLVKAIGDLREGKGASSLGKQVWKLRVARTGEGKRGSYRTIIAYVKNRRAIYLQGFEKSERANISTKELDALQLQGKAFLAMSPEDIAVAVGGSALRPLEEKEHGKQNHQGGA